MTKEASWNSALAPRPPLPPGLRDSEAHRHFLAFFEERLRVARVGSGEEPGEREQREAARNTVREKKLDEAMATLLREVRDRAYVELREPPQ